MAIIRTALLITGCLLLVWLLATMVRIRILTARAGEAIGRTARFEQTGKGASILVLGDSIAYGTGTSAPHKSVAGLVAANFPDATVTNLARNGKRAYQLAKELKDVAGHYDLILVIVGGNDIIRPYISLEYSAQGLDKVYAHASSHADHVIALTTGNFRYTTFFLPPLNRYFEKRSVYLRDQAQIAAQSYSNVTYINLVDFNETEPFSADMEAPDHLHLSDTGAAYWHKAIKLATDNYTFKPDHRQN